jgi:hypothetical protein
MIGALAQAADYHITLLKPSVVAGTELKPGEYKVVVVNDKMVINRDRSSVEAPVKTVVVDKKYSTTTVRYELKAAKYNVLEIEIGGTKTKLILNEIKPLPGV